MNLREGILDALIDDGESIVQVEEYLTYLGIEFKRNDTISLLQQLLNENKIKIEYPSEFRAHKELRISVIEEYWFELTKHGYMEWEKT